MPNNALSESFDNGTGAISQAWNIDTSVRGEVKLSGNASMMEYATGREAGHGYGTYTFTAKVDGNQPGPAILLWPGDNRWPGQEIDIVEVTPDGSGRQYGNVHWNNNGSDAYTARIYDGVGGGVFHDYQMTWEPGRITFRVDGAEKGVVTNNVPTDFDHGGMNNVIGFLNNNPNTSVTVSNVNFSPSSGGGGGGPSVSVPSVAQPEPAPPAAQTTPAASSGAIDWNALAAQITANYQATGSWSATPGPAQTAPTQTASPAPAQPAAPPAPAPAPTASSGPVDWNALAAQVTANHDATGGWFM